MDKRKFYFSFGQKLRTKVFGPFWGKGDKDKGSVVEVRVTVEVSGV